MKQLPIPGYDPGFDRTSLDARLYRARPPRVVIIAGEHSGDALGAKLIDALEARLPGGVVFSGVGGHAMEERNFRSDFPLSDIAVMGPLAILKRLPTLVRRVYRSVDVALAANPDIVVLIDAPEFTHPVAKRIRKRSPGIPIIDYVSPTVWAWRPGRARKMARFVDHVLALLPFEPEAHRRLGGPVCSYVGHPLTERLPLFASLDSAKAMRDHGLDPARPLILVLPGSRRSEVERLTDVFGEALARFASEPAHRPYQYAIPALPHVRDLIEAKVAGWPAAAPRPVIFRGDVEATKFALFKAARAALAASGTVSLELAIAGTPMVIAYKVDIVVSMFRHLIKTDTTVLPNLITGQRAIPEFHQEDCTPERLASALTAAAGETADRAAQLAELAEVPLRLALPAGMVPSAAAAEIVLYYLDQRLAQLNDDNVAGG